MNQLQCTYADIALKKNGNSHMSKLHFINTLTVKTYELKNSKTYFTI